MIIEAKSSRYGVELGLTPHNLTLLQVLVETDAEYRMFLDLFWKDNNTKRQIFSILEFREHKLNNRQYLLRDFLGQYNMDKQLALQKLFLQPIGKTDVNILEKKITDGSTTLEKIYIQHKNNPPLNFLKLIL